MRRTIVPFLLSCLALFAASCGTGPQAGSNIKSGGGGGGSIKNVNHIVIMMQENRSFDHYFGQLGAYRAAQGAGQASDIDGLPANISLKTYCAYRGYTTGVCAGVPATVSPIHMKSMCTVDLTSSWQETHNAINLYNPTIVTNNPPMDGAAAMQGGFCYNSGCFDVAGQRSLAYYTEADIPFYYWAATQFATSNRWFSAVPARTQLNRMYLLAATSQGHTQSAALTQMTAKTIFESLETATPPISWKVYVTNFNPASPSSGTYMTYFNSFTSNHLDHFVDAKTFATDAANGTLPAVSLIESGYESGQDEHPLNNLQTGAAYAETFVNALMKGPNWKDSVFFLTFDEYGGFYDHVPPMATVNPDGIAPLDIPAGQPTGDFTITGLRLPLMVISPFTKPHFVSNTPADFTAMLKFIETRYNLQPLTKRDAAQMDMQEFFDWSAPNLASTNPPTQQTDGACYYTSLP
ncbi:MAG TPA: alkaline phosphatase family protein [Terriglobales bacterium]